VTKMTSCYSRLGQRLGQPPRVMLRFVRRGYYGAAVFVHWLYCSHGNDWPDYVALEYLTCMHPCSGGDSGNCAYAH
jgi:hypothetical protein